MTDRTCSIDGCEKPPRSGAAEWCPKHYHRWYRHGDPLATATRPPKRDLVGERFGNLTVLERVDGRFWICRCDCGQNNRVATGDLNRGTVTSCGDRTHRRSHDAGYSAAHARTTGERGPASRLTCIDCDAPASHWSYDHDDPDERISDDGLPYSLDTSHYEPRCVPCHKAFDLGHPHRAA